MTISDVFSSRMTVTELGEFLRTPPAGFSVETLGSSGYRILSDPEQSLLLLDDFLSCTGERIVVHKSLGRKVKMHNLWEYTDMRKSLMSKRICLLVLACQEVPHSKKKARKELRVLKQFVVSIHGGEPFIKWQMEKGLNWTISSVAGESYRVDIDLTEAMESWARKNLDEELMKAGPVWRDASFTLKYYSDALFDFPHWFGYSKRKFMLRLT